MRVLPLVALVGGLVFGLIGSARAGELPQYGLVELCEKGELIVEGKWDGGEQVAVTRVFKRPKSFAAETKQISVSGLGQLSRVATVNFAAKKKIETKNVTLFLTRDAKNAASWAPIDVIDQGSCGVFWWDDQTCYTYVQIMNPGGYELVSGDDESFWSEVLKLQGEGNVDRAALQKRIENGLVAVERYATVNAVPDRQKRARFLVRYLSKRDSPDPTGAYFITAGKALAELKEDAVPALVAAIEANPTGEDNYHLILPLYRMGKAAAPAKAVLLKVLERQGVNSVPAINALEKLEDRSVIPQLRTCLGSPVIGANYEAAHLLAKYGDRESFDTIVTLIPPKVTESTRHEISRLLHDLHALDPQKARPLVQKYANDPAMKSLRDSVRELLK